MSKFSYSDTKTIGFYIGDFAQLIWAETTRIGCGISDCVADNNKGFLQINFPRTVMFVCNYYQGGNLGDAPIYKPGTPCSECQNGCSKAYPFLCA